MGYFPDTIAAALAGNLVRYTKLVELSFADGMGRYWEGGLGTLETNDGKTWAGTGELGSISTLESALGATAPQVTLSLSGVSPQILTESIHAKDNVKGRDATVYMQFFDPQWVPLDNPYAVFFGVMDVMTVKQASVSQWTIELTLESLFTKRARPPFGYMSDRSQKGLYPGDRGMEFMASMRLATAFWPVF